MLSLRTLLVLLVIHISRLSATTIQLNFPDTEWPDVQQTINAVTRTLENAPLTTVALFTGCVSSYQLFLKYPATPLDKRQTRDWAMPAAGLAASVIVLAYLRNK